MDFMYFWSVVVCANVWTWWASILVPTVPRGGHFLQDLALLYICFASQVAPLVIGTFEGSLFAVRALEQHWNVQLSTGVVHHFHLVIEVVQFRQLHQYFRLQCLQGYLLLVARKVLLLVSDALVDFREDSFDLGVTWAICPAALPATCSTHCEVTDSILRREVVMTGAVVANRLVKDWHEVCPSRLGYQSIESTLSCSL